MNQHKKKINHFLPVSISEIKNPDLNQLDIVLITGDAYIDHPSFGTAVIGRVLEDSGFSVGIISMPDWKNPESVNIFGRPRLFFGITGGAIDSMLAKYTALKRYRSDNPYAPAGKGSKPERAVIVYCNLIKQMYKDIPIVLGGIEASMRRIAHYDFWDDKVRRSIIEDSRADILVYGMGEKQIIEIAHRIDTGKDLKNIPGTVIMSKEIPDNSMMLPSEEDASKSRKIFIELYRKFYTNQLKILTQQCGNRYLVHYPPAEMNSMELDKIYDLPFTYLPHPLYREKIPAYEMIKDSITSHRGCFSGCSFCSLSLHQGKKIISRSAESVTRDVQKLAQNKTFKGHITDIGGPSANMYGFSCAKKWKCGRESCLFPSLCKNLQSGTGKWIDLLKKASSVKGIKKVSIGSGIRYDLFMIDKKSRKHLETLIRSHISGQLKIAPESTSKRVLRAMRKTPLFRLDEFIKLFKALTKKAGKEQYLIPYIMTCHPGEAGNDIIKIKQDVVSLFGFIPEQVQMFIPLPMTLSSVIYYSGEDPLTGEKFPSAKKTEERGKQHKNFLLKTSRKNRSANEL